MTKMHSKKPSRNTTTMLYSEFLMSWERLVKIQLCVDLNQSIAIGTLKSHMKKLELVDVKDKTQRDYAGGVGWRR